MDESRSFFLSHDQTFPLGTEDVCDWSWKVLLKKEKVRASQSCKICRIKNLKETAMTWLDYGK